MAFSITDGKVQECGTRGKDKKARPGKVLEDVKQDHGAAIRIAQDRGKPSDSTALGGDDKLHAELAASNATKAETRKEEG